MAYYQHAPLESNSASYRSASIISGDGLSSFAPASIPASDQAWVVFSPDSDVDTVDGYAETDVDQTAQNSQFALPQHNGQGSFGEGSSVHDRVSAWTLDQSQLVFKELQSFERRSRRDVSSDLAGLTDPTADAMYTFDAGDSASQRTQPPEKTSLWTRLSRRVMNDLGLKQQVLEVIFGERFVDPSQELATASPRPTPHYDAATVHGPAGWESALIRQVLRNPPSWLLEYLSNLLYSREQKPSHEPSHEPSQLYPEVAPLVQLWQLPIGDKGMEHRSDNFWDSSVYASSQEVY